MIFLKGLVLGFSVAAPVGPIGLLCIQRTLNKGKLAGFLSGLGAATADAIYSSIAAFGFTVVSRFLVREQIWFHIVGGIFLLYLGIRTFFTEPAGNAAKLQANNPLTMYLSTFILTITNPATILSFIAMFAGLGLASSGSHTFSSAAALVVSVFAGSAAWWFLLSSGVTLFGKWFNAHRLRWVNRISGIIITLLGVLSLGSL